MDGANSEGRLCEQACNRGYTRGPCREEHVQSKAKAPGTAATAGSALQNNHDQVFVNPGRAGCEYDFGTECSIPRSASTYVILQKYSYWSILDWYTRSHYFVVVVLYIEITHFFLSAATCSFLHGSKDVSTDDDMSTCL